MNDIDMEKNMENNTVMWIWFCNDMLQDCVTKLYLSDCSKQVVLEYLLNCKELKEWWSGNEE